METFNNYYLLPCPVVFFVLVACFIICDIMYRLKQGFEYIMASEAVHL